MESPEKTTNPVRKRTSDSRIILIVVLVGLVLVCLFGLRAVQAVRNVRQAHFGTGQPLEVQQVRGWMTVEYLSRVYNVPQDYLLNGLSIPATTGNAQKSLSALNREYYPGQRGIMVELAQTLIRAYMIPSAMPAITAMPPLTSVPPTPPLRTLSPVIPATPGLPLP